MTDQQLYLAIGIPSLLGLLSFVANLSLFVVLNGHFKSEVTRLDDRMNSLEHKIDTKFDLLLGKVFELDSRMSRIEEQLKR